MIDVNILAEFVANIISFFFSFLADVDLSPLANALDTVTPYLKAALYILPAKTIGQIFAVIVAIWSLRFVIKTVRAIWELLPVA